MQQLIGTYQSAFGDAHWTVNEILEAGDRVITRWTGTGTHSGDLMGLAPTNRKVSVTGIMIQRVVNGKIAETYDNWDMYTMLQQLGVAPAMGAAA